MDIIDKIEKEVLEGKLIKEIVEYTPYEKCEALQKLKVEDEKRYEEIQKNIQKNLHEVRSKNGKNSERIIFHDINLKLEMAKKVAAQEINIFDASRELNFSIFDFLFFLNQIPDKELALELKPILATYGFGMKLENTKSLSTYPFETQKEIVLMALTYRVSPRTIAKMFHTTLEDVIKTFCSFDSLRKAVEALFIETIAEDDINEKVALRDAKAYLKKRNELIKALNEAKSLEEKEEIKKEIKNLHSLIDDTLLVEAIQKNPKELTQKEKDLIAKYPLKYYVSIENSALSLKMDRDRIIRYVQNLEKRNMIFAEKMTLHNHVMCSKHSAYLSPMTTPHFSRGGGSR